MMKKLISFLVILLLSLSLVGTGCSNKDNDGKEEKITLRLGHEMPESHPYHLGAAKFAELLTQKTNGKYEVVLYPNGQLGNQKQAAEMVSNNQLDMTLVWQGILEAYDPNAGVISLPFIFRDWNHVYKVVDGSIGEELFKGVEQKGIKVLTNFNNGLYNIVSRVPIEKPEDMKGVKLRVQSSPIFTAAGETLGAVVTPMAFSEVYSALQLGAIDAEIQGPINVRKSKHNEVAKYTCECRINYLLEPLIMSAEKFNSLPAEDQKAFTEAAHEAAEWQRENAEKSDTDDTNFLKENGMEYAQVDINEWKKSTQAVYDKYPEWKDMIEKINSIQ